MSSQSHKSKGSAALRFRLKAKYGAFYRRYPGNADRCCYCGLGVDLSDDHVPPLDCVDGNGPGYYEIRGIMFWIVRACRQCNSTLANRANLSTIHERAAFMAGWLKTRYAKQLKAPAWDDEEMKNMGYGLKRYVKGADNAAAVAKRRVAWAEGHALPEVGSCPVAPSTQALPRLDLDGYPIGG